MSEEKARLKAKKTPEVDVVDSPEVRTVVAPRPRPVNVKSISFEQWAALKGIRPQHLRGMRAHVSDVHRPRPASEWDQVFSNY